MYWFLEQRSHYYLDILLKNKPDARADVRGSDAYPELRGTVKFYQTKDGVLVCAELVGLPHEDNPCAGGVFALHIHEGTSCTGNAEDPFADIKGHYNPNDCPHPYHAGDLPPLFEAKGRAFLVVLTDRFRAEDVVGRTVIIHAERDDFTSQPAGNAGKKIACGVIRR